MKVVFLDFDGVLNSKNWRNIPRSQKEIDRDLDPAAIALLNDLLEVSGANVVISSSWRWSCRLPSIVEDMMTLGFKYPERVIGFTPYLNRYNSGLKHPMTRGEEVALWLKQVPVEAFVILDDRPEFDNLKDNLVLTDREHGLQKEHVEHAMEILDVKPAT
jgi:hypothetical protein